MPEPHERQMLNEEIYTSDKTLFVEGFAYNNLNNKQESLVRV